jgi:peptidoglycan hydrolase-like amidase
MPYRAVPAAVLALLSCAAQLVGAGPARAGTAEVYPVPAGGTFTLAGHGWGHGHGLSQWGAYGAATTGVSAATILSTYYPNTATASYPDQSIRVLLTEAGAGPLEAVPSRGLAILDESSGTRTTLPATEAGAQVRRWRITLDSAGEHVSDDTGSWQPASLGGRTTWTGPLAFTASAPVTIVFPDGTQASYRGMVAAVAVGGGLAAVNTLPVEDYLDGVVPRESPASWPAAALQAQAVAARSYALYHVLYDHAAAWDICDSTACQVYGGYGAEVPASNAAVDATQGQVRTYAGRVIFAEYSASNGGWSVPGGQPYLVAGADPWDCVRRDSTGACTSNPVHDWTGTVSAADLEAAFPAVGRLLRLAVTSRDGHGDWGGRVLEVQLQGVDAAGNPTTVNATGADVAAAGRGVRSDWWTVAPSPRGPAPYPGTIAGAVATGTGGLLLASENVSRHAEYRSWTSTGGWSAVTSLGGTVVGGVAAAVDDAGVTHVYARGADGHLYTRSVSTGSWTSLGGTLTAPPAAVHWGAGQVAVFARGRDGALYLRRWTRGGGWAPWSSLGGTLSAGASPGAVSAGAGQLVLYARWLDGSLRYRSYRSGPGWTRWQDTGEQISAGPAATATGDGHLLLAVRTATGQIAVATAAPTGAPGGFSFLGAATSAPTIAVVGGLEQVFALASGEWQVDTSGSGSSWSGWSAVG